eukprot:356960-Chlamydomonas_euryale.AAC.3
MPAPALALPLSLPLVFTLIFSLCYDAAHNLTCGLFLQQAVPHTGCFGSGFSACGLDGLQHMLKHPSCAAKGSHTGRWSEHANCRA